MTKPSKHGNNMQFRGTLQDVQSMPLFRDLSQTMAIGSFFQFDHYSYVLMGKVSSQITGAPIVYLTADHRKHQSFAPLAFVNRIYRWLVNSPHGSNAKNVSIWWRHHHDDDRIMYTYHNNRHKRNNKLFRATSNYFMNYHAMGSLILILNNEKSLDFEIKIINYQ